MKKGLLILIIGLATAAIGYVGHLTYQDIRDQREFEKEWTVGNQVDIQRLSDSAYHINLGDGTSCLTIEKLQDSLAINSVNILMAILDKDTLTVMSSAKSATWKYVYKFAYYDFFEDSIPEPDKISFNLN